ncbi:MAG: cell division ATP-binding protein FtsE [Deferribacteres bacterium]|nr:cell division ATP-binding protein FtsE [candidate division KSB1 bacterium]MCB9502931.1 cell division ATP-binding protein FtsE [Deferribacteres bacterium]
MKNIRFNNVTAKYSNGEGIEIANFDIKQGEFVFLSGPSGAGKTTILKLILMTLFPNRGSVEVGNFNSQTIHTKEIPLLRRQLGCVFQDFRLLDDRNVYENIAFVLRITGHREKYIKRRTFKMLAEVGLSHKRNQMPSQLSGGEQQRIAIARAMANDPFIVLADEPTGNLDPETSSGILDLFKVINERGTAVLMATHNRNLIDTFSYRTLQLQHGRIIG